MTRSSPVVFASSLVAKLERFQVTITDDRGEWGDGLATVRFLSQEPVSGAGAETELSIQRDGKSSLLMTTSPEGFTTCQSLFRVELE